MSHCIRSATVLDLTTLTAATATYTYDDDPDTTPAPTLTLPVDRYTGLGSPTQVTVTVEPGDRLNEDDISEAMTEDDGYVTDTRH